jgi:hypothetical protein
MSALENKLAGFFARFICDNRNLSNIAIALIVPMLLLTAASGIARAANPVANITIPYLSNSVPRDSVTLGGIPPLCTDASGKPVSGATISFSITSPGEIIGPVGSTTISSTGTTASNGEVTMVFCSSDISYNPTTATITASCGNVQTSATVTFIKGVTIFDNGAEITNQTETCYVGEEHTLRLGAGEGFSAAWMVGGNGTPVASWNQNYNPATTSTPQISPYLETQIFYLTTPGTASLTVDVEGTGADGRIKSTTLTASITIQAPPACTFSAVQNHVVDSYEVGADPYAGGPLYSYMVQDGQTGLEGIQFTYGGGNGGTLELAQIINSFQIKLGGTPATLNISFPALDNHFPYRGGLVDVPSYSNSYNTWYNEFEVSGDFTMYLLWKSSKTSSLPICVKQIPWSFDGAFTVASATDPTISWTTQHPDSDENQIQSTDASGLLTWNNVAINMN